MSFSYRLVRNILFSCFLSTNVKMGNIQIYLSLCIGVKFCLILREENLLGIYENRIFMGIF
jgi:hypothetical protein